MVNILPKVTCKCISLIPLAISSLYSFPRSLNDQLLVRHFMICQKKKILVVSHHFDVFYHLSYACLLRLFADGAMELSFTRFSL